MSVSYDPATKILTWTQTGIGSSTVTLTGTSNGLTVNTSFTENFLAAPTTLGNTLIASDGATNVANITGVSNGPQFFFVPVAGLSGTLMTDQQIKDLLTINFNTGGNYGCTSGVGTKTNWTVEKANNRIKIDYNVVADTKADNFLVNIGGASYAFTIMGVNN
jgi:hypothetical protein